MNQNNSLEKIQLINNKIIHQYLFCNNNLNYNRFFGISGILPFYINAKLIDTNFYRDIVLFFDIFILNIIKKHLTLTVSHMPYFLLQNLFNKNKKQKDNILNINISDMIISQKTEKSNIKLYNFQNKDKLNENFRIDFSILDSNYSLPIIQQ